MNFMNKLKNTLENNSFTENGMKGYNTSGHFLVDMDFKISSYRDKTEEEILRDFQKLLSEESIVNIIKWMFYVRDVREGNGERRLFKIMLKYLATYDYRMTKELISIVPVYGRWDDLFCLMDTRLKKDVISFIKETFISDVRNFGEGNPVSLLAKWMPSINTSSESTRNLAKVFIKEFNLTEKEYRKILSALRKKIDVVEKKMSNNEWSKINYDGVPSSANLIYSKAFYKHDKERREEFLKGLKTGKREIKSQNLFPYQIYCKMKQSITKSEEETLEAMWKTKIDKDDKNINSTLVVCDTSGSMTWHPINNSVYPIDIATSLAIYFSEKNTGVFKNKFITFSSRPSFIDLNNFHSLKEKIRYVSSMRINDNTDISAVFKLILDTAISNNLKQNDLPKRILIISDMEFDTLNSSFYSNGYDVKDFERIKKDFEFYDYNMPKLIFWNVESRTNTIPMKKNKEGVFLISGFSDKRLEMIMSEQKEPYLALLETINSKRYDLVQNKIAKVAMVY